MPTLHLENLSPFGRLAVELDGHFLELTRLSEQIQRLDIDSESGLDRAVKLLNQVAEHGKIISQGMQGFSKILQDARARSEVAAKLVAERAQSIHQRKQHQNEIREKLARVEENVKAANANLAGFEKEGESGFTDEERSKIKVALKRLNVDLKRFLADAQAIKEAAGQSKFKTIEHDASKLLDALRSSCRRIDKAISEQ